MGLFDSIRRAVGGGDDGSAQTEAGPTLVDVTALGPDDFRDRAENAASDGDPLDFSVASLARLDEAIAAKDDWTEDRPSDGTAYSEKAVQFGSYLGEVLVRTYDGEWTPDDGWSVTVTGPDEAVTVAVFEVAVRSVAGDPVFAAAADRLEAELELADERGSNEADTATDDATQDVAETDEDDDTATDATAGRDAEDVDLIAPEDDGPIESDETADEPSGGVHDAREVTVAEEVYPTLDAAEPAAEASSDSSSVSAQTDVTVDGPVADPDRAETAVEDHAERLPPTGDIEATGAGTTPADLEAAGEPSDRLGPDERGPDGEADTDEQQTDETVAAARDSTDRESPESETGPTPATDPTAGDGLRAEYATAATEFTAFWSERDLDFTPASLDHLDDLVGAEWDDDRFADATFGSETTFDDRAFTSVTTELGSYFGEVLVRELDGEWTADTDHEAVVVVEGTDGPLAVPVFQVAANSLRTVPVFARSYEALLSDLGRDA